MNYSEEKNEPLPETQEELEARYQKALDAAGRQLSYRALSVASLKQKLLEKGHAEDAAEYAAAWLSERRLLNDSELAAALVRTYTRKGYGVLRIRQELRRHGIEKEDTDAALEGFDADLEQLTALLDKRLRGDLSDRKEVRKAVAALQRRGFLWSQIRSALDAYGAGLEEEPDFD